MNQKPIDNSQEFILAREMKEEYCNESGKETNPAKAAEILHRIGLIYRKRSPDKISLIKSAGLLNAAIVRNPPNVSQVKSDLSELCRHILEQSNANNQTVDLIGKSEQVKDLITKLRYEVKQFLKRKVPKVSGISSKTSLTALNKTKTTAIQKLNKLIAHKYKQIMVELSQYCEDVMGKAPCEYTVVGMGSLAREEITAYSDFEHIILLFDDKNCKSYLEYFKWFSVIFHIVILNLQETIVPSLNIASLNGKDSGLGDWFYDHVTPRGISFDGMMPHACKFPLGRQQHTKHKQFTTELIKPVSEMLEYLSSDADLKNGYHLADILTKTCFVFGNTDVFKQFVKGAQKYHDTKSQTDTINDIKKQVKQDLNNFSTRFRLSSLKSQHTINIKQLVYRSTTIFISALARKHNISANSCFDIIDEMANNKQITQNTADKLKFAVAIACEMRLRVYTNMKSQCDNAIDLQQDGIEKFLDIVGEACTMNYFQIAYCLQCEVAIQLNFTKLHFYTDPQLINITIGLAFERKDLSSFIENSQKEVWNSSKFDFDACLEKLESQMNSQSPKKIQTRASSSKQTDLTHQQIKSVANHLHSTKIFDEAVEFYKQLLHIYESKSTNTNRDYDVAWANYKIGHCLFKLKKPAEALSYSRQALEIEENLSQNVEGDRRTVANTLNNIGLCHIDLHSYDEALTNLNRALEIYQNATLNADANRNVANTLNNIGLCHKNLHNYDEALTNLNRALEIYQNTNLNANTDQGVAGTLHGIGLCHIGLHNYDEALRNLNRALEIYQNTTRNADADWNVATTLSNIGLCHKDLHKYDEALTNLNRALEIHQNATLNADANRDVANTLNNIGSCHIDLHSYDEALRNLNRSLEIHQNTNLNADANRNVANTLKNIGLCHIHLHNYDEALRNLNRALEIYQNATLNADADQGVANTLTGIGLYHFCLHNYDEALTNLNRALEIHQNATLNANANRDVANTLNNIGLCHIHLHNYDEALRNLNRSLEIHPNTNLNADANRNVANTLKNIGLCHIHLHNYDEALRNLNRALEIRQNTNLNADNDRDVANTLSNIGLCHIHLHNYDEALTNLNRALEIDQTTTLNADADRNVATTLHNIGLCHIDLHNYDEALKNLNRALEIHQKTNLNANADRDVANTLSNIGLCHIHLHNYNEALRNLNRALEIYQNATLNADADRDVANTLNNIGLCHIDLHNYDEALRNLNRALEIYQNTTLNADADWNVANTLHCIGLCHNDLQNCDDAFPNRHQTSKRRLKRKLI